jgi:uncharacterized protein involved in copper resistance
MDAAGRLGYPTAMLRKILIFLLTLWLATPAFALPACHESAPPKQHQTMAGADHDNHHTPPQMPSETSPEQARLAHMCIGCAVPITGATLLHRAMIAPILHWTAPSSDLAALSRSPETPPPRG